MQKIIMIVVILVSAGFGYYMYADLMADPIDIENTNPTADLTYITIGEDGTNCVVSIPASVEADLAELGVYKWLAACQERYGD